MPACQCGTDRTRQKLLHTYSDRRTWADQIPETGHTARTHTTVRRYQSHHHPPPNHRTHTRPFTSCFSNPRDTSKVTCLAVQPDSSHA